MFNGKIQTYKQTEKTRTTLPKIFKGTSFFYLYNAMLDTIMFNPHLKAILNGQECPLLLHHLNNASKALATRNSIQEMSCQSPWGLEHFCNF